MRIIVAAGGLGLIPFPYLALAIRLLAWLANSVKTFPYYDIPIKRILLVSARESADTSAHHAFFHATFRFCRTIQFMKLELLLLLPRIATVRNPSRARYI